MDAHTRAAARAWACEGRVSGGEKDPRQEAEAAARRAWEAAEGAHAPVVAHTGDAPEIEQGPGVCRACGASGTLEMRSFQTRSADEAATLFEVCTACGASRRAEDD